MAELNLVDAEYITRMTGFEADCNNGKGDPMACHQVGEFFSLIKNDRERAGVVYEKNCTSQKYSASCFNLAKLYLTGKGVVQSDAKAEEYFKQSCAGGNLYGCYHQVSRLWYHSWNHIVIFSATSSDVIHLSPCLALSPMHITNTLYLTPMIS